MPHTETYIDGVWHPSVTTIMYVEPKPWVDKWRAKWGPLAERKTRIACQIGDEFHRCVDQYLATGQFSLEGAAPEFPISCSARVVGMMESFIEWAISVEGVVHATELKVVSRLHTYSGTLDAVGTLNGQLVVFDWKTSSRINEDMGMQLSAYAQAYKEQTGVDIKQGIIVHVSKDKPRFKLTTKMFKLGKRVFNKFVKLRSMFDDMRASEGLEERQKEPTNAEITVNEAPSGTTTEDVHPAQSEAREADQPKA